MSIQTTPFLHLPQWTAEEQPSFLGEINPAWEAIDSGYGDIKTRTDTAITSANAAANTANSSMQQSQANAGQITQLQQRLQNLENRIGLSNVLQYKNIETTISSDYAGMIEGITCSVVYNDYTSIITLELRLKENLSFTLPNGKYTLATLNNFPFTYSTLNLTTDLSTINTSLTLNETQTATGVYCQISGGKLLMYISSGFSTVTTTTQTNINVRESFPIFVGNAGRGAIPENCLLLPVTEAD